MNYMLTRNFYPTFWNKRFHERFFQGNGEAEESSSFDVDITENDTEFVLKANLPGFDADDVNISLERNHLKIEADNSEADTHSNETRTLYWERPHGKRQRSFVLSDSSDIKPESIQASMDKGILTITVQKKEESKKLNIEVSRK